MPLYTIDYTKTIIYKLCCYDLSITDIYVGHTTDFKSRKNSHKTCCNNKCNKRYNLKLYQFIRENGGWNNWNMVMIENHICNSKLEATKRERELIEELKATLNTNTPSRTKKEWTEDNEDKRCESSKKYREANKDKLNEKINCECGGCFKYVNKAEHLKSNIHIEYNKLQTNIEII